MNRNLLCLLFLILLSCNLQAQRKTITLHIVEEESHDDISNAHVFYDGKSYYSNEGGYVTMKKPGKHSVFKISHKNMRDEYVQARYLKHNPTVYMSVNDSIQSVRDSSLFIKWHAEDSVNELTWAKIDAQYPDVEDIITFSGKKNPESVYKITDIEGQAASFKGGQAELNSWLSKYLNYPQYAVERELEGKAYIKFVVEADGQVTNVFVAKRAHYVLDREAIRVIRSMPKWEPGRISDEPVRSYFILPLTFSLQ